MQNLLREEMILGGRAMVDYLMTEYGSPTAHPLCEESVFVVAPGLLAGTCTPIGTAFLWAGRVP